MSITDQLLAALALYGPPALFVVLMIGCAGIPLPSSLMLVAAGAFVQLGEMKLWQVITVASAGSVLGDQIGYGLGRWGGRVAERFSRRLGGEEKLKIPEGTQSDAVFRVKGKGLPDPRGGGKGDLYYHVRVLTPTKLTREQRKLMEQLGATLKVENKPADRNSSIFEKVKDIFG